MIAHVDADAFFASVLQRHDPRLKGKPLLALGMGGGCVIAASYEAKAKGVKTGMRLREARKLCPEAMCKPSNFGETILASRQIEAVITACCPAVEQMSVDEWYLDLTALPGGEPFDVLLWARDLQQEILRKTALSVSIGIAPTKTLAKMAGEERKPAGVTVVEPHDIEAFLNRRPAAAIPGIGRRREVQAKAQHWQTAWDIAMADPTLLRTLFGRPGLDLQRELRGERVWQVTTEQGPPKSISRCRSFPCTHDRDIMRGWLLQHLSITVLKLRDQQLQTNMLALWLRNEHYRHLGWQLRLPTPMDTEEMLTPYVQACLERLSPQLQGCTQAGLCLTDLRPRGTKQYSLFTPPAVLVRDERLQHSLDTLRKRFGRDVVMRGTGAAIWQRKGQRIDLSVIGADDGGNPFLA